VVTFECSGTAIGGDLMSTAEWTGPALAPLIERARPRKGGVELVMEGVDAGLDELVPVPLYYGRSIPMSMLPVLPGILALKMNGEPIRPEHGHPVRAILPGLYGTSHVKWVGRLTVVTEPYMGFYQTQRYVGWYRVPEGIQIREILRQRVKSQFARIQPAPEAGPGVYRAVGAAWSGGEGISRVEVSTDAGRTWNRARVTESRGPFAWVVWNFDWVPGPGKHEVVVRATDGRGRTQPMQRDDTNLTGYINNWCHRWALNVPA
jgi:DMSO/TMAO reductase YedYZ molybdopterin-dependent catalytic subunit